MKVTYYGMEANWTPATGWRCVDGSTFIRNPPEGFPVLDSCSFSTDIRGNLFKYLCDYNFQNPFSGFFTRPGQAFIGTSSFTGGNGWWPYCYVDGCGVARITVRLAKEVGTGSSFSSSTYKYSWGFVQFDGPLSDGTFDIPWAATYPREPYFGGVGTVTSNCPELDDAAVADPVKLTITLKKGLP
jgi:hypothetical protein